MIGATLVLGFGVVYEFLQTAISFKMHPTYNGLRICKIRLVISVISLIGFITSKKIDRKCIDRIHYKCSAQFDLNISHRFPKIWSWLLYSVYLGISIKGCILLLFFISLARFTCRSELYDTIFIERGLPTNNKKMKSMCDMYNLQVSWNIRIFYLHANIEVTGFQNERDIHLHHCFGNYRCPACLSVCGGITLIHL